MSAQKRRADDDLDNESIATSSPLTSSSQGGSINGRKRRRVENESDTTPERIERLEDSDSDSDSDSYEEDPDVVREAQEYATQVVREKHQQAKERGNRAKESGVIETVTLYDFMCHHYFEFKLGPLMNFVCGKNGSGKSAILTAIVLCLGGKATATNRGSKMASMINHNADRGRIVCKLANRGEFAYMHEKFGDSIIIERHFARSGTSGYKISGVLNNKVISTKKNDLDLIVDHFNLQIDNPLNVLSQDMTRSFISAKDPSEKYKHFIKGVQLEQLDQDYHLINENARTMIPKLQLAKDEVDSKKQLLKQAKTKLKEAQYQHTLKEQSREVRRQIVWSMVVFDEGRLADKQRTVEQQNEKIQQLKIEVERLQQDFNQADDLWQEKNTKLEEAKTAKHNIIDEKRQIMNGYDEVNADLEKANVEKREVRDTMYATLKSIKSHEDDIRKEEERIREANGGAAAQRLVDLEIAQEKLQQSKNDLTTHQGIRAGLEHDLEETKRKSEDSLKMRKQRTDTVKSLQEKIRTLSEKGRDQNRAFRMNNDKLEAAISREKGWRQPPIGPAGKYVRLLKPEWSSIIERVFGRNLTDYVVFNKQDADLFDRLKSQVRCDAQAVIHNTKRITPNEPDAQHLTILRALEIDNEWIQKHLIISSAIEQALLINDLEEASATMFDNGRLRFVKSCYTKDPNRRQDGVLLRYSQNNRPSQDPVKGWDSQPRMKGDQAAELAARVAELEAAEAELKEIDHIVKLTKTQFILAETARKRYFNREKELRNVISAVEDEVERLKQAIADDQIEDGALGALREIVAELVKNKDLYEGQYNDAASTLEEKKKIVAGHKQRLIDIDRQIAELDRDCKKAQMALQQVDQVKTKSLHDKNAEAAKAKDAENDLSEFLLKIEDIKKTIQERVVFAQRFSERVAIPDGETTESLETEFARLKRMLQEYRKARGYSYEEVMKEVADAELKLAEAKSDLKGAGETIVLMRAAVKARRERWTQFRIAITARAAAAFRSTLGVRGFRGELKIDHPNKRLDLSVEPDLTRKSAGGREAKTLSGGEKSYSQVCLLLAIWEAMGSPIRGLDEFDVFMDGANRKVAVDLLTEAARQSCGMQYILISPGSKADYTRAPDVSVCDLGEPDRTGAQRTLNETGFGETQ